MDHPSHPTSKVSSVYKQTTTKTFRDTVRESAPQTSHALRIFLAVVAFVKLIEALFWLALLLEETHNDSDHSTPFLTFMLATGFIISLTTGFVSLFGPCFQAIFLQTSIVLWSCVANFVWDSILLVLSFVLGGYCTDYKYLLIFLGVWLYLVLRKTFMPIFRLPLSKVDT